MANPRITKAVALGNFIAVRDRIAEILMCEFAEQETLQTDPAEIGDIQNTNVYPERVNPLNDAALLELAIYLSTCAYYNQHLQTQTGRREFFSHITARTTDTH